VSQVYGVEPSPVSRIGPSSIPPERSIRPSSLKNHAPVVNDRSSFRLRPTRAPTHSTSSGAGAPGYPSGWAVAVPPRCGAIDEDRFFLVYRRDRFNNRSHFPFASEQIAYRYVQYVHVERFSWVIRTLKLRELSLFCVVFFWGDELLR
jgi:hypothetical protein